jgi:hypothetical protein
MGKSEFQISLESGEHKHLKAITGTWEGPTKTWLEPGLIEDMSRMQGTIRRIRVM